MLKPLFLPLLLLALARAASPNSAETATFVKECNARNSRVVLPGESTYPEAVKMFVNLFSYRHPAMIVFATEEAVVSLAVNFARAHQMKVSTRSGGNSNLGWGTCNGCLVVDVSGIKSFSIDKPNLQATVGPGVNNRVMTDNVSTQGLAIPQGDCPMVCMGGYATGGGLALSSRLLGMNVDAVLEYRVVGADGVVRVASATEHPDLFWALRGGSGINFGIVTQLKYQGQTIPEKMLGGHLSYTMTATNAAGVADAMYDAIWGAGDPADMRPFGFSLGWVPGATGTEFRLMGLWYDDDLDKGQSVLDKFRALPGYNKTASAMLNGSFYDVMQPLMDQYNDFHDLNWTMPDAMIAKPSSKADFSKFVSTVTTRALQQPAGSLLAWVFAPLGGKVNDFPSDHTAYPWRNTGGNFHMPTIWFKPELSASVRKFGQDSLALVKPWWEPIGTTSTDNKDPASYVNHPSEYLSDYHQAYWGSNLAKLKQVKAKYDPDDFLTNGQGIAPMTFSPTPAPTPAPEEKSTGSGLSSGAIAGIVIACLTVLAVGAVLLRKPEEAGGGGGGSQKGEQDLRALMEAGGGDNL